MLAEKLWEVKILHDSNCPGEYSTKRYFDKKEDAQKYIDNYIGEDDYFDEVSPNEYDSAGPNWKPIKIYQSNDDIDNETIILSEITNKDFLR